MPRRPGVALAPINMPSSRDEDPPEPAIVTLDVLHFPDMDGDFPFTAADIDFGVNIGKGGQCDSVRRAVHRKTKKQMAVKGMRCHVDANSRMLINRELYTQYNALECKSIVCFYGASFSEGSCLLCMELMDVSLEQLHQAKLKQEGRFSEIFIWLLAVEILTALSFLRLKMNRMHRDVKPPNILFSRAGLVKLCDFGLACELFNSVAKTKGAVGSKKYMAPERITDMQNEYGAASDVFSLGLVLYEVATGRFPPGYMTSSGEFHCLQDIVNGPSPQLSDTDAVGYSPELRDFVNKCLEKNPKVRPKFAGLQNHSFYTKYGSAVEEVRKTVGQEVKELLKTVPKGSDEDQMA